MRKEILLQEIIIKLGYWQPINFDLELYGWLQTSEIRSFAKLLNLNIACIWVWKGRRGARRWMEYFSSLLVCDWLKTKTRKFSAEKTVLTKVLNKSESEKLRFKCTWAVRCFWAIVVRDSSIIDIGVRYREVQSRILNERKSFVKRVRRSCLIDYRNSENRVIQ